MKGTASLLIFVFSIVGFLAWTEKAEAKSGMQMKEFGQTADGQKISLYTLTNKNGMEVAISTFGGCIVSLKVPDKSGKMADVVLGYDNVQGYVSDRAFFGATIGRYGNRIGKAEFKLDGNTYTLPKNDGANTLHGGPNAFNKKVWTAKDVSDSKGPALDLSLVDKDGYNGFPGNLSVNVKFSLTDSNELKIEYTATTDKPTVVNLTNHSYFNLKGQGEGDILEHELTIVADRFTPVDSGLIPLGELRPVKGTPFDFTKATAIGARIEQSDEQLKLGHGYDHNWVLNSGGKKMSLAAEVYEPKSGRVMQVLTTEPGVQFYTGNFLDGSAHGKDGKTYGRRSGLCLETQHFPDSPNKPSFPSTTLKPGQKYDTTTIYKFSVKK